MKVLPPTHKSAVSSHENYYVLRSEDGGITWQIVESQPTYWKGCKGRDILQKHDDKNGRSHIQYIVMEKKECEL